MNWNSAEMIELLQAPNSSLEDFLQSTNLSCWYVYTVSTITKSPCNKSPERVSGWYIPKFN